MLKSQYYHDVFDEKMHKICYKIHVGIVYLLKNFFVLLSKKDNWGSLSDWMWVSEWGWVSKFECEWASLSEWENVSE